MASPASSSRFTTPSPVPLSSPLSSSATSPRYWSAQSSVLTGDGARQVPLMEHLRRLKCGSGGGVGTRQPANGFPDHSASAAASTTTVPVLSDVGLKDLLLSNDDDEVMTTSVNPRSSGSEISPTGSSSSSSAHDCTGSSGHCSSDGDQLFNRGKIFLSDTVDRPDSSTTKRSKPAVLLMRLLSRPDNEVDDDDVPAGSSSSSNDMSTNLTSASPPTSGTVQSDGTPPSADKLDSVFESHDSGQGLSEDGNSEQPAHNKLLRVLHIMCPVCHSHAHTLSFCPS